MKKEEQKQDQKEHVVATFGRFQPPTTGHHKLIKKIHELSQHHGADHIVFASASKDNKKNPLPFKEKIEFMQNMFQGTNVYNKSNVKDMLGMMKHLQKEGYKKATIVVGEDRIKEINNLLHKYNGKEYKFDHISVVSSGSRDPDSEGVAGVSGSKMREHAKQGNFKEFVKGIPNNQQAKELYKAVRKNMKLENNSCLFVVGGPGSGKDFLIRTILSEHKILEINLDKVHKAIQEQKDIEEINEGVSLIVNGNADDSEKIFLTKKVLETVGYKTAMVYVYTTNEASKDRNDVRILSGSRTFTEEVRLEKYVKSSENLKTFSEGFESFFIFNNSFDIEKVNEETKEEVLGWMNELQDIVEKFFGVNKTLDEQFEELFKEDRRNEYGANQELARTHRMDIVKSNHPPKSSGDDYFSYQAKKTNAAKKPVATPLKAHTVAPSKHLAKEEASPKKHKKAAKPPVVNSDIRAGDGMSATSTLAAEEEKMHRFKIFNLSNNTSNVVVARNEKEVHAMAKAKGMKNIKVQKLDDLKEGKVLSKIKENLSLKSPDAEFSTKEVYEDWGVEGKEGIFEGRAVSLNKPFKTNKGYSVYVEDGSSVKRLEFSRKKITLQENVAENDVRFWESK